jgi:serine O-acetyltransferase
MARCYGWYQSTENLEGRVMPNSTQEKHRSTELKAVDPVWFNIRRDAEEIAKNDPSLSSFIFASVLNHDSLEGALCHRLVQRLGHQDIPDEFIRQAVEDAFEDKPVISDALRADLMAVYDRDPACDRLIEPLLYFKGFQAIQSYRIAHWLWHIGRRDFALWMQSRVSQTLNIDISPTAKIGRGIMIDHGSGVVIGATAEIGDNVSLLHAVTLGGTGKETGDRHPKVGSGVLLGAGAKVLGNITIGDCVRVASGSVVLHAVPPNRTVAGVPARIVGYAGCEEPASKMDQIITSDDE